MGISNIGHTFRNFKSVAGVKESLEAMRNLAEGTSPVPIVFCYGGVGNGKTHLLEALVIRLNERGLYSRLYLWRNIVSLFKRHLDKEAEPPFDELLGRFCQARQLIIDDVGIGVTDTAWEQAQLETIIDYRYSHELVTALATNKDISELPSRVLSRLSDKAVCIMCLNKSDDFRKLKGEK